MKNFARESIAHFAKYIKIFFEGSLKIEKLGYFRFEHGRICCPVDATQQQKAIVGLVNQRIKSNLPVAQWD